MNSSSSDDISGALLAAPYQLNIWFGLFLWITGNCGCIGNMIVFCSKSFRNRAYSVYLLSEAMSDFHYFNFVLLTRILQKGFQIPIMIRYVNICRYRQFASVWGNQVSFTLFSFATIDRLLSAQRSNKYRQWSNRLSLSYKLSIACVLFWFLLIGHRLILYNIYDGTCGPPAGVYAEYDNYFEVVFAGICPPIVMSLLTYLLIKSVRNVIQRRITPGNNVVQPAVVPRTILQQMDTQLTLMLILQSVITIITYVPYAVQLIYENVTQYWSKSSLRIAQESVFTEFTHLLSYVFFASSFYVSMITNGGFRRQIKRVFLPQKTNEHIDHMNTVQRTIVSAHTQPK
ncbi:unnamed protein product [Adineta steineri]|uniref:G-protein coupled receptors family 1 profile domain-containing protein n=1 Tax=Adineta steineri TaxID=433720 RepID=A0A813TSZ5_9BILA|nr:unnamed protein product [Adineta steineri]CAF4001915.1 unnamed protein product [Adineta steineri]